MIKAFGWRVIVLWGLLCGVGLAADNSNAPPDIDICFVVVTISQEKAPQSAAHIIDAQAAGYPWILTIDRHGAKRRRTQSLRGMPTKPGFDRDEYPPAVFAEGGKGASVRYIPANDNRSAGAQIGNQLKSRPDGCNVLLTTAP